MQNTDQLARVEPPPGTASPVEAHRSWRHFARHYLEMVVAMVAGMAVLGGALRVVLAIAGADYSMARFPELTIMEMALTMTVAMTWWMRHRGHGWTSTLEMGAAMVAPALAVLVPVRLGALDVHAAMVVEHVAMFALMLVVMLRRRDEYSVGHHGPRWALDRRRVVRGLVRGLVVLLVLFAVPAAVFTAGSTAYEQSRYEQREGPGGAGDLDAPVPAHDPAKPTAVVVVGNGGANVADALVPYDVLAGTGAFNVYTVAPERRPLPLLGGLDLVPHLSFAQLGERLGGAAPEVTVVPEMPESSSDTEVIGWLRDTAGGGLVLGVCTGARLLADAGLLDGRPATTHWYRLDRLAQRHPQVDWQRGVRYVDDGDVITTGGLLSSVDGSLRVIERLLGTDAAATAADAVGWPSYSPGTASALPGSRVGPAEAIVHLLNTGFRANGTTVGVVLSDGVGELELASAFAPYGEVKSARTLAIAAGGDSIVSRHGLTFVPRADLEAVGGTDRLIVPGLAARPGPDVTEAARRAGVPVVDLHQQPGFAFDGALRDMAAATDVATTRWAAEILEYSRTDLRLTGSAWPWAPTLQVLFLGLVGVAAALGVEQLVRRRRAGRS